MILREKGIIILLISLMVGCAAKSNIPAIHTPPRCPHHIWTDEALLQYSNLFDWQELSKRGILINSETGLPVDIKVDLIERNIGEYNRHCNAIDAYLDADIK